MPSEASEAAARRMAARIQSDREINEYVRNLDVESKIHLLRGLASMLAADDAICDTCMGWGEMEIYYGAGNTPPKHERCKTCNGTGLKMKDATTIYYGE